jgi:phosphoribosylaminoimidazolecarboxamide formyltransferase/IMP cyclohydrolase
MTFKRFIFDLLSKVQIFANMVFVAGKWNAWILSGHIALSPNFHTFAPSLTHSFIYMQKKIRSALISVYHKDGLELVVKQLQGIGATIYSTGGTFSFIEKLGVAVEAVEDLTGYPSILDGRVKTLHPKIFGGILARREESHLNQLQQYDIPEIDLVIVDLYPFEQTLLDTDEEDTLIEKIDIGGIALLRAAAKNYKDVLVVSSRDQYEDVAALIAEHGGANEMTRRAYAAAAFRRSSSYDKAISEWVGMDKQVLRYGENPHQEAAFVGNLEEILTKLQGKELSFNNLVDIDGAVRLMQEFKDDHPTFAVIKHTNACGLATRPTVLEAWKAALAGDPVSAFGGILICNAEIDSATATEIDQLFYEVLIAPSFSEEAMAILSKKKKRILLRLNQYPENGQVVKSCLNGEVVQDYDGRRSKSNDLKVVTNRQPTAAEMEDLLFAEVSVKHLKSNGIALIKNGQLVGMGCGQTSRVDALRQAIAKAKHFGLDVKGAVMASDAFFPFPDCVEIAHEAGIEAVIQPGGSIKDQDSIDYCNAHHMTMVTTGVRHFKH